MVKLSYKIIIAVLIVAIIALPFTLLIIPTIVSGKVNGVVGLLGLLDDPTALGLGGFSFVDREEETVTLRLDLSIDNTESDSSLLFPAINVSFNFGSTPLGVGWISEEVTIPAATQGKVPIYAKMKRGDVFNQFFMNILAGGLSLSMGTADIFLTLDTYGNNPGGVLSISIPGGIPLPEMSLGGDPSAFAPFIHSVYRDDVSANNSVEVLVNASDKGNGLEQVILSYSIDSGAWVNVSMTGIPYKELMGGDSTVLGGIMKQIFEGYPESTIPTTWSNCTVNATILGVDTGSTVRYRIYTIDTVNNTVIAPSSTPNMTIGTETIDLNNEYFSYTVGSSTLDNFTAIWKKATGTGDDLMTDILDDLGSSGVDLEGMILESSDTLAALADFDLTGGIDLEELELVFENLFTSLQPLFIKLDENGVSPVEVLDQLLGMSGGMPSVDASWKFNANMSVALDMLTEAQLSLIDLITLLGVNISKMMDLMVIDFYKPINNPLYNQYLQNGNLSSALAVNPIEGLLSLAKTYLQDSTRNATFQTFLIDNDLDYIELHDLLVYMDVNLTDGIDVDNNYSIEANNTIVDDVIINGTTYYGSPEAIGLLGPEGIPSTEIDILNIEMGTTTNNQSMDLAWEYFDGSNWNLLEIISDETNNLSNSGRIEFNTTYLKNWDLSTINYTLPNGTETAIEAYWIRCNISNNPYSIIPKASMMTVSKDFIKYFLANLNSDFLTRPYLEYNENTTSSFQDMIMNANATNGYLSAVLSMFKYRNTSFTYEYVANNIFNYYDTTTNNYYGAPLTPPSPIAGAEVIQIQAFMLALLIYPLLGLALYATFHGMSGVYQFSPDKVKKWYDEHTKEGKKKQIDSDYTSIKLEEDDEEV
ncbi:MAG: hypothetical protein GF329_05455 [Candidatus Lokiarchaeota archaeon]|nr:hypothetical protein [Candidatus Lokiarchaeota archaeon]